MKKLDKVDLFSIFLCCLTIIGLLMGLLISQRIPKILLVMGISGLALDGIISLAGIIQKKWKLTVVYVVVTLVMLTVTLYAS